MSESEFWMPYHLLQQASTYPTITCGDYFYREQELGPPADHPFYFELYVSPNKAALDKMVDNLCKLQPKAIMVTADLPVFSKRETNEQYEKRIAKQKRASEPKTTTAERQDKLGRVGYRLTLTYAGATLSGLLKERVFPSSSKGSSAREMYCKRGKSGARVSTSLIMADELPTQLNLRYLLSPKCVYITPSF
ncbi:hypothetical protein N7481_009259 [Penicillium waksmanii]|uniref:uncharacterized protein n=1 Tax=Penicillium waksmanii TaxID=69791 RepID=UPI0025481935|nr:uncharacterized protein N7481_009259 [Penicillium waksmanii]KAJ5975552.1 hypothetical protein N7481_009259 [Penicillium waksmanii]